MPDASATEGIEKMTISDVTSIVQTKSGIRASVMPGARLLEDGRDEARPQPRAPRPR